MKVVSVEAFLLVAPRFSREQGAVQSAFNNVWLKHLTPSAPPISSTDPPGLTFSESMHVVETLESSAVVILVNKEGINHCWASTDRSPCRQCSACRRSLHYVPSACAGTVEARVSPLQRLWFRMNPRRCMVRGDLNRLVPLAVDFHFAA